MLRIEFDREAMIAAGGSIKSKVTGSSKDFSTRDYMDFNGQHISLNNGIPDIYDGNRLYPLTENLEQFVTNASFYENFGQGLTPHRQLGEYHLKSATAQLEIIGGAQQHYHMKIQAKNLKDLHELFNLIREGQIWPAKDYEREQVPPPFRHLRNLASEAWQLIRRDVRNRLQRIKESIKFAT